MNERMTEPATRRARLVVAYDGSGFHGFAPNDGVATVAETLRQAIARVARKPVDLVGAGRTDAGVHAWGQVVSCDLPAGTDLDGLVRRINSMCGPAIVARSAEWAEPDFDARFSAVWRRYRYTILNSPAPDPFLATTAWHVPKPLSMTAVRLGVDPLIGEHDFSAFCRRPKVSANSGPPATPPSMVRRVLDAHWEVVASERAQPLLVFEIRATAFCHQMVRSVVGTLIDVGLGRLHAGDVRGILLGGDRSRAGRVAPPHGLCLWDVGYPGS